MEQNGAERTATQGTGRHSRNGPPLKERSRTEQGTEQNGAEQSGTEAEPARKVGGQGGHLAETYHKPSPT